MEGQDTPAPTVRHKSDLDGQVEVTYPVPVQGDLSRRHSHNENPPIGPSKSGATVWVITLGFTGRNSTDDTVWDCGVITVRYCPIG